VGLEAANNSTGETGFVVPITIGTPDVFGTVEAVSNSQELTGVDCPSASDCVAVGDQSGTNSHQAVVDFIPGPTGTPAAGQDLTNASGFSGVGCTSASTCYASGNYAGTGVIDPVTDGVAGTGTLPEVYGMGLNGVFACALGTTICEGVGNDNSTGTTAEVVKVTAGVPGTVQTVPGATRLSGAACTSATSCVAVGVGTNGSSGQNGAEVALTPGATPPSASLDPDAANLTDVGCISATSCVAVGQTTANVGLVLDVAVTVSTGTISGNVAVTIKGVTSSVSGAPVQACNTDGSYCTSNTVSTDSSGNYTVTVPSGATYTVTAFSPANESYTSGDSTTTESVPASGVTGINVAMGPGPGLDAGVKIISSEFGTESSDSAVPTVNWGQSFQVELSASMFPQGETTTIETLVITGINTVTGQLSSVTIYAGGETTITSGPDAGQIAAIGLVVGPSGVTLTVPPLSPIHGPVTLSLTSFSVPNPPSGVALGGPNPVIFTNGAPTQGAPIVATDIGVDHTVGTPTISGADASRFSLAAPGCAPSATIVVYSTSAPGTNTTCDISVKWTPPTIPGKAYYQATMNVPVTDSAGQPATLLVPLLGCDTRVVPGSSCGGGVTTSTTTGGTSTIGGVYVDPSGTVQTSAGVPISGASVALARQDSADSSYTTVPNGSDIMSPGNRVNPQTTGADGGFGWDTIAGTYEITAQKAGCGSAVTSPAETVPPPVTGIVLTLACPTPTLASTTTTLTPTPTTPQPGQAVNFAIGVTSSGGTPTGSVTLSEHGTPFSTIALDSTNGTASFSTVLPPGSHTVTATYNGDSAHAGSSTPATFTVAGVTMAASHTTAVAAATAQSGQPNTYSATVTSTATTVIPVGPVTFTTKLAAQPAVSLCTAPLVNGTATCTASNAPEGSDTVTASYGGDTNFISSTGSAPQVVSTYPYTPVAPVRICDTRPGNPSDLTSSPSNQCGGGFGNPGTTLAAGTTTSINVAGSFGVPADASAVVLNVTAVGKNAGGYVTVFPTDATRPTASNLNFTSGVAVPNLVAVGIGTSGQVSLYASAQTDLIVDLEGYVAPTTSSATPSGLYTPLPSPVRLCDTRPGNPSHLTGTENTQCNGGTNNPGGTLIAKTPRSIIVGGFDTIPANATAVVLNVTVANAQAAGYLTVYPGNETTPPTSSNVNYQPGQASANRVIVPLALINGKGDINLYSSAGADVIVDASGYYTAAGSAGGQFTAESAPVRICDTRPTSPVNQCSLKTIAGGNHLDLVVRGLGGVPSDATAVVVNLTGISPSQSTYLTVFPFGTTMPPSSDINLVSGEVRPNLVVATINSSGEISIYNSNGSVNVAVDVLGWYS